MAVRTEVFSSGRYRIELDMDYHGFAEVPRQPSSDELCIWINPRLKGKTRLETIVHECIHAEFPDMSEDQVESAGTNIGRLLWRLGYRQEDKKS